MAGAWHERRAVTSIVGRVAEIVVVDPSCDRYGDFVRAAQDGLVGLHFCVDGASAIRLARQRFQVDAWLVAAELPDIAGHDLVDMLDRSNIFIVAEDYRLDDEQRALAAGVAGYLVGPVTLDTILAGWPMSASRERRACHPA